MLKTLLFLCIAFLAPSILQAKSGLVELDEYSFDKLINKFDAAVVKFDVAYPYGDKHDAFKALATEARDVDEILVADLNVKDYGERDNEALAAKYGATKDNFPVVKLFKKGKKEPIDFDQSGGFTIDRLRLFVREHTGLHLVLPGCVRELDTLAIKFVAADPQKRKGVFEEFDKVRKGLAEKHAKSGEVYKTIMKRILEKGDAFIKTENERVKKLLKEKVSNEKKKELENRLNILQTFHLALTEKEKKNKEDL